MASIKDIRLIVRCSKMYYEEGMKQEEIGGKLEISKATVSRLLNLAKELGIVKITVENPYSKESIELEKSLEDKFGLQEVIIADVNSNDESEVKREIAREAAKYLQRILKQDTLIGIASGTTLAEIPKYIQNNRMNKFTFVPIVGGSGQSRAEIQSNNIAVRFAKAFNADYKILHAPAMVEKLESKCAFIDDPGIKSVLSLSKNLDVALIGIGSSTSKSTVNMVAEFIKPSELVEMKEQGAVADVCNIFIDENGKSDIFETNKRVIGIDISQLKSTPITIAIAGNIEKAQAIWGVINAKLINVLITDKITAQAMLTNEVK
ncbi:sugar-binding transcriptional regulator [Alkalibaculum sporogenes]|nr:sugar-binding transcriptional regulator [Alkalibaculum sporogenes]